MSTKPNFLRDIKPSFGGPPSESRGHWGRGRPAAATSEGDPLRAAGRPGRAAAPGRVTPAWWSGRCARGEPLMETVSCEAGLRPRASPRLAGRGRPWGPSQPVPVPSPRIPGKPLFPGSRPPEEGRRGPARSCRKEVSAPETRAGSQEAADAPRGASVSRPRCTGVRLHPRTFPASACRSDPPPPLGDTGPDTAFN